ncbi:unnamed protein product [Agarophyton chilense]
MRLGWLYFGVMAVLAAPGRFTSVFLQAHGLSLSKVGILLAIQPICDLIATPFFCNYSDIHNNREETAMLLAIFSLFFFCCQIIALPGLDLIKGNQLFLFFLAVRVLYGLVAAPAYALMNGTILLALKLRHGHKGHELMGHERLFGAVSWALVSLGIGLLLDIFSSSMIVVYVFSVVCTFSYVLCINAYVRNSKQSREENECSLLAVEENDDGNSLNLAECPSQRVTAVHFVKQLFSSDGLATSFFFNLIFWEAAGMTLVTNLLFLFMQDELQSSNLQCGISVIITVMFEFPLFAKSPELLSSFGTSGLAKLGASCFVLRAVMYSVAPNAWFVLLAEPLHGVTFALFCTASTAFISDRVPRELEATGQSMISVVTSLGRILGTVCGGYVMETYGSHLLYAGASIMVAIAIIAFHIVDCRSNRRCSPNLDYI